jgi:hypothetical protein
MAARARNSLSVMFSFQPQFCNRKYLIRGVAFGGSGLIRRGLLYNIFFIICGLNCISVYVLFVSAGKDVVWFDRYGRKNGFIVYILRYFLLQNWGRNLHIVDKEFLALAAMAFGRPKEKQYQQIALRPTPRCASIASCVMITANIKI